VKPQLIAAGAVRRPAAPIVQGLSGGVRCEQASAIRARIPVGGQVTRGHHAVVVGVGQKAVPGGPVLVVCVAVPPQQDVAVSCPERKLRGALHEVRPHYSPFAVEGGNEVSQRAET
jgi:hypothetical protein